MPLPPVPIWIAGSGERMLGLAARYAVGWNGGAAKFPDGEPFTAKLAGLREACRKIGRDPSEIEVSSFTNAIVSPNERHAAEVVEKLREIAGGISVDEVRKRFVVGTPDQVIEGLRQHVAWGITHLI